MEDFKPTNKTDKQLLSHLYWASELLANKVFDSEIQDQFSEETGELRDELIHRPKKIDTWTLDTFKRVNEHEGTKNGEIRKIPMNKKLTETLEGAKKLSKGEYVFSENGEPYGDVKTGWWTALKNAGIEDFTFHGSAPYLWVTFRDGRG